MKRPLPFAQPFSLALALLLTACAAAASENPAPTVGSITRNNGLEKDRYVYVRTPGIFHVDKAKDPPPPADVRAAIDNYDSAAAASPDPLIRAESLRRAADLRLQLADNGDANLDLEAVRKAIAGYQRILADYPGYSGDDRVLYQLARAQQLNGDSEVAINTLRTLGRDYPDSPRMGDAEFRAAELLYTRGRYEEAEPEYRKVLSRGDGTPYFEAAQYKYGWDLYKQSRYRDALPVFVGILERDLPQAAPDDPVAAVEAMAPAKREMGGDALRVAGLSFAALGGGSAINDFFAASGEPRFSVLLYQSLGRQMLDRQRYSDAAGAYAAFIQRHPAHPLAPQMQSQVVAAYREGGFGDQVAREEGRYVEAYAPGTAYWGGKPATPAVMTEMRRDLGELAPWYHARAQHDPDTDPAAKRADFIAAAGWYNRILTLYPQDAQAPELSLLYADSLYDGGQTRDAALQYDKTAYGYAGNAKATEAAYASIQAWQRLGHEVPPEQRPEALKQSVAASIKFADSFPAAPQVAPVLTRAAEDEYESKNLDQAIALSGRVLALNGANAAAPDLRVQSLGVLADAKFAQARYADAESAYTQLLGVTPASDAAHGIVVGQLAVSIYKQGDAARGAGDLRTAAALFQRVGQVTPDASIRPDADYDAASAYYSLQDWPAAEQLLEGFRARNPQHRLLADADKKLATAYDKDNKPALAAAAYQRVAQRTGEDPDTRREASWLAASLYDKAGAAHPAQDAYEGYLKGYPQPLDRATEARQRLVALNANDNARHAYWLHELVNADAVAGSSRTDASKLAAAGAALELGRLGAAQAQALELKLPLAASLARRKQATEYAIAALDAAAAYGYADITTAAAFETGGVYRDFARALMQSERPSRLKGDELEQYNVLLEEQADPFEQKAIDAHLANLKRLRQGVWNPWIEKSAAELTELAPALYGKNEQRENTYEALR